MSLNQKVNVGLVQIGNSFSGQYYLPYSVGLLQAYAQKYLRDRESFNFMIPVYKREKIDNAVSYLSSADIVFFSVYMWNFSLSTSIARKVKASYPDVTIVFGGPQIPKNPEALSSFFAKYPFVDLGCFGEGEIPFLLILEGYGSRDWIDVPSAGYVERGTLKINNEAARIADLNQIPSPYLEDVFRPLMERDRDVKWSVMWETNRGCPFSCSFCAWGSKTNKKVYSYDIERLYKEIDWFSRNKIEFVFCCDANFGIFKRDLDIVEYVARNKEKYGYPVALSVQNTKNSSKRIYNLQKLITEYNLQKGVNLALQSVNDETLKSIKRANISTETYQELQKLFNSEDIPTFTDLILGLPNETYDSFTSGVSRIIQNGQYNNIQFINLAILENTDMAEAEYQEKYGLVITESKIKYHHGSIEDGEEVDEIQKLIVGSNTMPKKDWAKARVFSWSVSILFFDRLLQIPLIFLNKLYKIKYKDMFELFIIDCPGEYTLFKELNSSLVDKAEDIQRGGAEYVPSVDWLNIWWPVDEYIFIKLSINNQLEDFYNEAEKILFDYMKRTNIRFSEELIRDCILLNRYLIKQPFIKTDMEIELSYNIPECYSSFLINEDIEVKRKAKKYTINRTSEKWSSWEEWEREMVWYGKKRGAYFYDLF